MKMHRHKTARIIGNQWIVTTWCGKKVLTHNATPFDSKTECKMCLTKKSKA